MDQRGWHRTLGEMLVYTKNQMRGREAKAVTLCALIFELCEFVSLCSKA